MCKKFAIVLAFLFLSSTAVVAKESFAFNWFGLRKTNTDVSVKNNPAQTKVQIKHNNGNKHYKKHKQKKVKVQVK